MGYSRLLSSLTEEYNTNRELADNSLLLICLTCSLLTAVSVIWGKTTDGGTKDFAGKDYIEEVHHLLQLVHLESPENVVE